MPTVTAAAPNDVLELASRLRLGVTRLARRLRQEGEPGITASQLSALASIERRGRVTVGELCAIERVQPPTLTRLLATLVEAGLVRREVDPSDRRIAWLSCTPEGTRSLARSRRRKEAFLARRLRDLGPDELRLLERAASILERLVEGSS
jgi:DNA-binding MarR family transcriptional regulator